jgi:hypothetical protein
MAENQSSVEGSYILLVASSEYGKDLLIGTMKYEILF